MLLIVSDQPERIADLAACFSNLQARATAYRAINPTALPACEAFLLDCSLASRHPIACEIIDRTDRPVFILYDRLNGDTLREFTCRGMQHFIHVDEIPTLDLDAYIYRILNRHRRTSLVLDIENWLTGQINSDSHRTHGLLDALYSGLLAVSGDGTIHLANFTLEFLLGTELRQYQGLALDAVLGMPEVNAQTRRALTFATNNVGKRNRMLIETDAGFLERVILPVYHEGKPGGVLLIFRDVTAEVDIGLIDPLLGLPVREHMAALLARQLRRFEHISGKPCRELLVGILAPTESDRLHETIASNNEHSLEFTRLLESVLAVPAILCRHHADALLFIIPGDADRAHLLVERLRSSTVRTPAFKFALGIACQDQSTGVTIPEKDATRFSDRLEVWQQEAEQALYKVGDVPDGAVLYTHAGGFQAI